MPSRKSAVARLFDHFHEHPRGRLHELLFFAAIGVAFVAGAYVAYKRHDLSEPLAWLVALVGFCFLGFSVLPQKKRAPPPPELKGKRGELAAKKKSTTTHKRKGPPPPIG